jgi:hypothetical protein
MKGHLRQGGRFCISSLRLCYYLSKSNETGEKESIQDTQGRPDKIIHQRLGRPDVLDKTRQDDRVAMKMMTCKLGTMKLHVQFSSVSIRSFVLCGSRKHESVIEMCICWTFKSRTSLTLAQECVLTVRGGREPLKVVRITVVMRAQR